jgi:hypothetical protein
MSNFDQRFYLIGCAVTGLLSNPTIANNRPEETAKLAIAHADALMSELNPTIPQGEPMAIIASRTKRISFEDD